MKYISFSPVCGPQSIVLFPNFIGHADMLAALQSRLSVEEVLGAGWVDEDMNCYGYSTGLDIKSRHEEDTKLIDRFLDEPR